MIEKCAPPVLPVWTSWSPDWKRLGQWHDYERPPVWKLAEGGALTVEYPNGHRKRWRVYGWRLVDEAELLKPILLWPSPFLEDLPGESTP